ncbi:protein of unknown function DUF885 [Cellulomonas flavigena DSM 20109]|uniref:DUF885 domain-containing protein n=1 Tax=Cellulomonas flavigena (strain ATCC 482 / DSM 20109 / BCRC 11376 / JCM 18109 / NBRC 3775 / NCIMB 8073 / NRS 134) TaxID=446466 RepID=D5UKX5_CELFN|nr:DUF885 domain-containing protein [Cellulomonas flavigena]ADG73943.1 protein of unknown function DUF885 [Cellulomonas flavigena DSM 20109]
MTSSTASRPVSPVDAVADAYVGTLARLHPLEATYLGIPGHDREMTDFSPDAAAERAAAARSTLLALEGLSAADEVDEVTVASMRWALGTGIALHDAGEHARYLNNIASPSQQVVEIFDLMPTDSEEAWDAVAARLATVPDALASYVASLRHAAAAGDVAAIRQVQAVIAQAREVADPERSAFTRLVRGDDARRALGDDHALRADLERNAATARRAYADLAEFLADELAPGAPQQDAVGRDRYALWSRHHVGAQLDLDETYAWGLEELARVQAEQAQVAAQVAGPGASVADAVAVLDADPARRLDDTTALQAWMQRTSDAAIEALDGTHFDIPAPVRTLECRIAPSHTGAIYYTGPSDDFSRPGRMWWSVPHDVTSFSTWRERTTVYHEGVPGHHLQIAQAVHERATLNSWRRLASWTSGHGEGWALYAERLMADLGFLDDPGDRLGMLDGQRLRAARVVFDLGMHLGLPAPAEVGTWTPESGWDFLRANVNMSESFVRFEYTRYLGWPGQAPSYKVGQRLWEKARDAARDAAAAQGRTFDVREFHARALSLGSVPLEVLPGALAR